MAPKQKVTERTPLVHVTPTFANGHDGGLSRPRSPLRRAPAWQCWSTTSPSHRFYLLILMSCIPFGGHFVKNGMSSLEQLMLDDKDFPITNHVPAVAGGPTFGQKRPPQHPLFSRLDLRGSSYLCHWHAA
uniref:Uncharacterized protein n=1 Tax=Hyaloperonospora arabidopsidis (strain Emoy2) TaxID=559515 RepID=M4C4T2_HYAAE